MLKVPTKSVCHTLCPLDVFVRPQHLGITGTGCLETLQHAQHPPPLELESRDTGSLPPNLRCPPTLLEWPVHYRRCGHSQKCPGRLDRMSTNITGRTQQCCKPHRRHEHIHAQTEHASLQYCAESTHNVGDARIQFAAYAQKHRNADVVWHRAQVTNHPPPSSPQKHTRNQCGDLCYSCI